MYISIYIYIYILFFYIIKYNVYFLLLFYMERQQKTTYVKKYFFSNMFNTNNIVTGLHIYTHIHITLAGIETYYFPILHFYLNRFHKILFNYTIFEI